MRRLVVISALAFMMAACGSSPAPSSAPAPAPATEVVTIAPSTVADTTTTSLDVETGEVIRMISLPAPSGDPELDALGAEIAGLEEQLAALDAAALGWEGTP